MSEPTPSGAPGERVSIQFRWEQYCALSLSQQRALHVPQAVWCRRAGRAESLLVERDSALWDELVAALGAAGVRWVAIPKDARRCARCGCTRALPCEGTRPCTQTGASERCSACPPPCAHHPRERCRACPELRVVLTRPSGPDPAQEPTDG